MTPYEVWIRTNMDRALAEWTLRATCDTIDEALAVARGIDRRQFVEAVEVRWVEDGDCVRRVVSA